MLLRKGDVKWTNESEYNSLEKLQCCRPVQISSKFARLLGTWNMLFGPSETCVTICAERVCGCTVRTARDEREVQLAYKMDKRDVSGNKICKYFHLIGEFS